MFLTARLGLVTFGVTLAAALGCSGQEKRQEPGQEAEFPASAIPQALLGIEQWKVTGAADQTEVFGLGADAGGGGARPVRFHARITFGADDAVLFEADTPLVFRHERRPGDAEAFPSETPEDVRLALAASALDALDNAPEPPADAVRTSTSGILAQGDGGSTLLERDQVELLPGKRACALIGFSTLYLRALVAIAGKPRALTSLEKDTQDCETMMTDAKELAKQLRDESCIPATALLEWHERYDLRPDKDDKLVVQTTVTYDSDTQSFRLGYYPPKFQGPIVVRLKRTGDLVAPSTYCHAKKNNSVVWASAPAGVNDGDELEVLYERDSR